MNQRNLALLAATTTSIIYGVNHSDFNIDGRIFIN